ncbi:hypothetical protein AAFF_G00044500 [Aldrovandia affinis]|uniref:Uncharacterized protein n=1 Tax=Aldrovandia affinis TaxID=143900 RepID=A0AAD7WF19_9TELE|nr:hypothetical protein AAFF_G00044500 [Aldrovandia affinis]
MLAPLRSPPPPPRFRMEMERNIWPALKADTRSCFLPPPPTTPSLRDPGPCGDPDTFFDANGEVGANRIPLKGRAWKRQLRPSLCVIARMMSSSQHPLLVYALVPTEEKATRSLHPSPSSW